MISYTELDEEWGQVRGPTMHDYELLPEGRKFYERLQEIAVEK